VEQLPRPVGQPSMKLVCSANSPTAAPRISIFSRAADRAGSTWSPAERDDGQGRAHEASQRRGRSTTGRVWGSARKIRCQRAQFRPGSWLQGLTTARLVSGERCRGFRVPGCAVVRWGPAVDRHHRLIDPVRSEGTATPRERVRDSSDHVLPMVNVVASSAANWVTSSTTVSPAGTPCGTRSPQEPASGRGWAAGVRPCGGAVAVLPVVAGVGRVRR
jgi:hypothetical protein